MNPGLGIPQRELTYVVRGAPEGRSFRLSKTEAEITDLASGTAYRFTVTAFNRNGEGPPSDPSPAVTTPDVPASPQNVTVSPGAKSITVRWDLGSNGGLALTGHWVEVMPGSKTSYVSGTSRFAVVTGLADDTEYSARVRAVNGVGDGQYSALVGPTRTFRLAAAPTNVTAQPRNGGADVTWVPPTDTGGGPITGYRVTANPGGISTGSSTNNTTTLLGLTNGVSYTISVQTVTDVGTGPAADAPTPVTPRTVPSAPASVTATGGIRKATVTWSAPSFDGGAAILGYRITPSPPEAPAVEVGADQSTAEVTGLQNGRMYSFYVSARNDAGYGSSTMSNVTATHPIPTAPTDVRAEPKVGEAIVEWHASDVAADYPVIEYRVTATPGGATIIVPTGRLSATVSSLDSTTEYTFVVEARNATGYSPASVPSLPITPVAPVCRPLLPGAALRPIAASPYSVIGGDLDGDGQTDVALVSTRGNRVTFLFGESNGESTRAVYGPFPTPSHLAAVDFDKDGNKDLAIATFGSTNVAILTSTGARTYGAVTQLAVGGAPLELAIGDFNRDGYPDIASVQPLADTTAVLLSNGSGAFLSAAVYSTGDEPRDVAAVDLDAQNGPDLVVLSQDDRRLRVLLNDGTGAFRTPVVYDVGPLPSTLTIGDFDRDGPVDVAVADANSGQVWVLKNDGAGVLAPTGLYDADVRLTAIEAADVDKDGALDLVVTTTADHAVVVLKNSGTGTFSATHRAAVAPWPRALAMVDIDADTNLDLAIASDLADALQIVRGRGDGTFVGPERSDTGMKLQLLTVADINKDGAPDLITGSEGTYELRPLLNAGNGTFTAASIISTVNNPITASASDLDGDGDVDIAVVGSTSATTNSVGVSRNTGSGTFIGPSIYLAGLRPARVAIGDVAGNTAPDLVVTTQGGVAAVSVLVNRGDATFESPVSYRVGSLPYAVAMADLDADGRLDVVVGHGNTSFNQISVLWGVADGTFTSPLTFPVDGAVYAVTIADVDGGGTLDVIAANFTRSRLELFLNTASRTFTPGITLATGEGPFTVTSDDIDGNGAADLASSDLNGHTVSLFLNRGAGTFDRFGVAGSASPAAVVTAQFDGTGAVDLAVVNYHSDDVRILLNRGCQ